MIWALTPLTDIGQWSRRSGLEIILIVLGTVLLARFIRWATDQFTSRAGAAHTRGDSLVSSEAAKHRHALAQVGAWTMLAALYSAAAILILQRLGVPLAGFVAPATVLGVALGFGAQRVVQDLLAGFFLIAERQYGFGDLVRISVTGVATPILGTVEELSLRITTVRSINGEVVITPNGQIVQVTNLSRDWARAVIDVPVPVSVDVTHASEVLKQVGAEAFEDDELRPLLLDAPSVMGVETLEADQFKIRIVARTLPGKQFDVSRALRAQITQRFLREGITLSTELATAEPTAT